MSRYNSKFSMQTHPVNRRKIIQRRKIIRLPGPQIYQPAPRWPIAAVALGFLALCVCCTFWSPEVQPARRRLLLFPVHFPIHLTHAGAHIVKEIGNEILKHGVEAADEFGEGKSIPRFSNIMPLKIGNT